MDKKIEIELFRYETLLFGKVLYIDEDLRGTGLLYAGDSIKIESRAIPSLDGAILYLRGNDKKADNYVFFEEYSSEKGAIEVAQDIKNGINFINEGTINKASSSVYRVI